MQQTTAGLVLASALPVAQLCKLLQNAMPARSSTQRGPLAIIRKRGVGGAFGGAHARTHFAMRRMCSHQKSIPFKTLDASCKCDSFSSRR